jgi:hypothetical protein
MAQLRKASPFARQETALFEAITQAVAGAEDPGNSANKASRRPLGAFLSAEPSFVIGTAAADGEDGSLAAVRLARAPHPSHMAALPQASAFQDAPMMITNDPSAPGQVGG